MPRPPTVDNLYDRRIGTAQYGNVQQTGSATVDANNSGTCKIVARDNEANTK